MTTEEHHPVNLVTIAAILIATLQIIYAGLCIREDYALAALTITSGISLGITVTLDVKNYYRRDRYLMAGVVFSTYGVIICNLLFLILITNMSSNSCKFLTSMKATGIVSLCLGIGYFMNGLAAISKDPRERACDHSISNGEVPPPYTRDQAVHPVDPIPDSPPPPLTPLDTQPLLPHLP